MSNQTLERVALVPSRSKLGQEAYLVIYTPFDPVGPENPDDPWIEQAYHHETRDAFPDLVKALKFAKQVAKKDFFGEVLVREARLINPYAEHGIDNPRNYHWKEIDDGYATNIHK